jgi:DNA-directed RNA polymerase specialized sigma54-like protein
VRRFTDDQLAGNFKEKGYPIARRTIAKYREQPRYSSGENEEEDVKIVDF